ncbi:MAG: hypothetical protein AVDCRST_MAG76-1507 [uncultured Acidimicrobiales bacterium]|uniref:J domain-containing protein n=1 Tax=uncultured Acidimicrobiales bacterium TaxID=310071 RepID=A0A6J4HXF9_9ACTN|nr:MAG: hypothetical protein AVDCRST_MAG76-1507 [uncultured Acidimicrobiales bacterium]
MVDPWEVLELDRDLATAERVRAAKRRLAKLHHPDVVAGGGGGAGAVAEASSRLAEVNRAVELALAELARRRLRPPGFGQLRAPARSLRRKRAASRDDADATFTIGSLPVEAFELVLLAFSAIGDPKVVDEPYLLEGQVDDPFLGVARVELAPEAGGSIVTVTTWPNPRATTPQPTAAQVAGRLLWEVRSLEGL